MLIFKPFDGYEIQGCRDFGDNSDKYVEPCDDIDAQFWTLYGHVDGEGVTAIGDFDSREYAEEIFFRITGRQFDNTTFRNGVA